MKRTIRSHNYIFLTSEGTTFQPGSYSFEPDIENLQVIGFSKGTDPKDAFERLLDESTYLKQTSFDEIFGMELVQTSSKTYFSLKHQR
jgi:hypothetical protein